MGIRGIAPIILNLTARNRCTTNIAAQLLYPWDIILVSMKQQTECAPQPV
jgi:hypothetical protein